MDPLSQAKRVLEIEAAAIAELISRLDENFSRAVEMLYACKGRVILSGMGKSGHIARKLAATFASTGTPAFYMDPAEGLHGDLGMVVRGDILVAISNSGETDEIINLLPSLKRFGIKLIAMVGNTTSTLAKTSDVVIDISVKEEACPLGLAPTASTTAALAMGDALAVALLEKRGFGAEDFARFHPGGSLGKKLILRVSDLMHTDREIPWVSLTTLMKDVIFEISDKKLGMTAVLDGEGRLAGIVTDGDLRRAMEKHRDMLDHQARDYMTRNPKTITKEELAAKALEVMESFKITSLVVLDQEQKPEGIIHLHDILKAGVV
jgi:arabinose-5-phosphate isomerase